MQTPQWQWKQRAFSHPIIKTKIADLEKLAAGRSHNSKGCYTAGACSLKEGINQTDSSCFPLIDRCVKYIKAPYTVYIWFVLLKSGHSQLDYSARCVV